MAGASCGGWTEQFLEVRVVCCHTLVSVEADLKCFLAKMGMDFWIDCCNVVMVFGFAD